MLSDGGEWKVLCQKGGNYLICTTQCDEGISDSLAYPSSNKWLLCDGNGETRGGDKLHGDYASVNEVTGFVSCQEIQSLKRQNSPKTDTERGAFPFLPAIISGESKSSYPCCQILITLLKPQGDAQ